MHLHSIAEHFSSERSASPRTSMRISPNNQQRRGCQAAWPPTASARSSARAHLEGTVDLALHIALGHVFALVVELLAAAET